MPEGIGPRTFRVLGPFPRLPAAGAGGRPGLDHEYLAALGGEPRVRLDAGATVLLDGHALTARDATLDRASVLDFTKVFPGDTDESTAYAYAEWTVDAAGRALALFGSDDGAAVWLNGQLVHRAARDRGLVADSDRFDLALDRGQNRLVVKVDNVAGAWGFALRVLDEAGQARFRAIEARRHIESFEPKPVTGTYFLDQSFPDLVWSDREAAASALANAAMHVRWYGPDLAAETRPDKDGQYTAVVEAETLDGYTTRQMIAFAKVAPDTIPSFSSPPTHEMPPLDIAWPFGVSLNEAQRAELSRHFWRGAAVSLSPGSRDSAVAALALVRLGAAPPPRAAETPDPLWLGCGFIQVAETELRLRLAIEGRRPAVLAPPEVTSKPAPELRAGSEAQAGMRAGTLERVRAVAAGWAKADRAPFVVLVARRGVVFFHEGYGGFRRDSTFYPASIGKTIAALTFARAVDQGLLGFDEPVGSVLADWSDERTAKVTFRNCFNHVSGLTGHASHGGMFNPYLDSALFVEDAAFATPRAHYRYNGDDVDLAGKALELTTGRSIWRLVYEDLEKPFGEPVHQLDLGFGGAFTAGYLAKVGQMILQDGRYGRYRFFSPGFLASLRPKRIIESAPGLDDAAIEAGIGLAWMIDPPGPRARGVLGPNVVGHGASSGVTWRIDPDHDLVIVVGRDGFKDSKTTDEWQTKLVTAIAQGLAP
jgi:CubicO group peptidase (beta-lactamase class C family)